MALTNPMKKLLRQLKSGEEISFFNAEANRQIAQQNWSKKQKNKGQYGYRLTSNLQTVNRNLVEAALKFGFIAKASNGNYGLSEKGKEACLNSDQNLLYWQIKISLKHESTTDDNLLQTLNPLTARWNCILTPVGPEGPIKLNDYDLFSLNHLNFRDLDDLLNEVAAKLARRGYTKKQIRILALTAEMKNIYQQQTYARKAERMRAAKAEAEEIKRQKATFNQSHVLMTSVTTIGLGKKAESILARMNVSVLGDLVALTETELLKERNCGRKTIYDIKTALSVADSSLFLGMTIPDWQTAEINRLNSQAPD